MASISIRYFSGEEIPFSMSQFDRLCFALQALHRIPLVFLGALLENMLGHKSHLKVSTVRFSQATFILDLVLELCLEPFGIPMMLIDREPRLRLFHPFVQIFLIEEHRLAHGAERLNFFVSAGRVSHGVANSRFSGCQAQASVVQREHGLIVSEPLRVSTWEGRMLKVIPQR